MHKTFQIRALAAAIGSALVLAACGGGGGSTGYTQMNGTAAEGTAIANSTLNIKDAAGKVVGASFVGRSFTEDLAALKAQIKAVRFGETGYAYVLDATPGKSLGTLVVHPAKEGQNVLDSKDASGRTFIRDILERKQGVIHYPWVNAELNEQAPRDKVVAFDTYPDLNWVIAGGTYVDEFESLAAAVGRQMILLGVIATGLLAGDRRAVARARAVLRAMTVAALHANTRA